MKQRLFVDMDGTLAEFHPVHSMEELHAKGYFAGLPPQQNVVEAVRILNADTDVEVYILSAVLSDSKYAFSLFWKRVINGNSRTKSADCVSVMTKSAVS